MPRFQRFKPSVRRRPAPTLERLEERQLLSTLSTGTLTTPPVQQPDIIAINPYPSAAFTPSQIRTAYGVNQISDEGQGMTVAIVDAYSQPDIKSDVNVFSTEFGLPKMDGAGGDPTLSIMVPTGQSAPPPAPKGGWGLEISLDVEWVHSIAPYANIDLVECQNDSGDSLFGAEVDGQPYSSGVVYAATLPGVVVVTNSYGGGEFNGETNYDGQFTTNPNVAYTFSTGDTGAPGGYPAYSPNVIAVGGTSLAVKSIAGKYGSEMGWSHGSDPWDNTNASGGGVSQYEATPAFQSSNGVNLGARSTPDVSWLADPNTGVYIYDTYDVGGYTVEGGTSLASPMWAGLIAIGDQERGSAGSLGTAAIQDLLYGAYDSSSYHSDFHDETVGYNGDNQYAGTGYDLVTGIGSPIAPAIASLFVPPAPSAVPAQRGTIGLPAGSGSGSISMAAVSQKLLVTYAYSQTGSTGANTAVLSMGSLTDLVTTVSTPKQKPAGGSLFGSN
jgi:subtilase family serine protease